MFSFSTLGFTGRMQGVGYKMLELKPSRACGASSNRSGCTVED